MAAQMDEFLIKPTPPHLVIETVHMLFFFFLRRVTCLKKKWSFEDSRALDATSEIKQK